MGGGEVYDGAAVRMLRFKPKQDRTRRIANLNCHASSTLDDPDERPPHTM